MIESPIGTSACGMTSGTSADWLRWSNAHRSRITGQANTTIISASTISSSSENRSSASRSFGGIMPTITSIRICRPDQATTPLPRNTQPTMRKSITSSAQ